MNPLRTVVIGAAIALSGCELTQEPFHSRYRALDQGIRVHDGTASVKYEGFMYMVFESSLTIARDNGDTLKFYIKTPARNHYILDRFSLNGADHRGTEGITEAFEAYKAELDSLIRAQEARQEQATQSLRKRIMGIKK